jgi:hypothetical protein
LDLDWSNDAVHKLAVTFAYTEWKNNSLQSLVMDIVEAGIGNAASALGGLGGSATGAIGSATNSITNAVSNFDTNSIG